jgi:hypothetical protein
MRILALLVLLAIPALAQQSRSTARSNQNGLSEAFCRPAQRAVEAIKKDNYSSYTSKNTPTSDRIDEAIQAANTEADKNLAETLRWFYTIKQAHNVVRKAAQLTGPAEQDRDVAKNEIDDSDCAEDLTTALKNRTFRDTPSSCRGSRSPARSSTK